MEATNLIRQNKKVIIALAITFCLPWLAGSLFYKYNEKFNLKTVNNGILVLPAHNLKLTNYIDTQKPKTGKTILEGKWNMVYIIPDKCEKECKDHIQLLTNIKKSLGKDSFRVNLLTTSKNNIPQNVDRSLIAKGGVILIDPKSKFLMRYEKNIFIKNPKGILKDLKRLLRYSKIG